MEFTRTIPAARPSGRLRKRRRSKTLPAFYSYHPDTRSASRLRRSGLLQANRCRTTGPHPTGCYKRKNRRKAVLTRNIVPASRQDSLAPSLALALRAPLRDVPNGCPACYSYHPDTRPDGPAELFQFAPGKLVVEEGSNLREAPTKKPPNGGLFVGAPVRIRT